MKSAVTSLKQHYGHGPVLIPATTRVRLEDGSTETLAKSVTGPVRGWEVMSRANGRQLEILVVTADRRRLRVAANRVQTLPMPAPVRFLRLRPSALPDLADN